MERIIGIGDLFVTNNTEMNLKTFALASCVGITVYCQRTRAAGMAHSVLPYPDPKRHQEFSDGFFVTTAITALIATMSQKYGCRKEELKINVFGGASRNFDYFNIGSKNIEAVKQMFNALGLKYVSNEVGGSCSRNVTISVATGEIIIYKQPLFSGIA